MAFFAQRLNNLKFVFWRNRIGAGPFRSAPKTSARLLCVSIAALCYDGRHRATVIADWLSVSYAFSFEQFLFTLDYYAAVIGGNGTSV